jgi:hypothetical protein
MKAFRIMGRTFKGAYDEFFLIIIVSLLWWAGTLLIVTAPLAMAGLQQVANRIANYRRVDLSFFWEGARARIVASIVLWLILVVAPPLFWLSVTFYFERGGWLLLLGTLLFWALVFLVMSAQYFFPLLWQQSDPSLGLLLRNAAVLAGRHPLYSLLMVLFQVVLIAISVILVLPLLMLPGVIALAQNYALVGLLQEMGLAPQPPEPSKV